MDIGPDKRKKAAAAALHIVELDEAGRYVGDGDTLLLSHVCVAHELMIESAETRMAEAALALAGLHTRMRDAERTRDRVSLEVLPSGWYWDTDDESRACKIDSPDFCEPTIGNQIRAIGFIAPRILMAVEVRANRLAIENGKVGTAPAAPIEFCVVTNGSKDALGPFLTLEEALDAGHSSGLAYRAGGVARPQAGNYLRLDDVTESLQSVATSGNWKLHDEYVFQSREGASEVLAMAFNAAFESDQWWIAAEALRYPANSREPSPVRAV